MIKEVYSQLKEEMGDVVEPISMHALFPELLVGIWSVLREVVLVEDQVLRRDKEAVGAAVSASNECPYCVDAHTIMIIGLKDQTTAKAIVKQDLSLITNSDLRDIVGWAFDSRNFKAHNIKNPVFDRKKAPEIIGTAVFFHYLNRMVTIFLGPTILPMNISFLKGAMKQMAAMMFSKVLQTEKKAKENQKKTKGVNDEILYWTRSNERIQLVYGYLKTVVDDIGQKYVPIEVRSFLQTHIDKWNGHDLHSTKGLDQLVSDVSPKNQPLAKMLYLTAFSPHRIQSYHFDEFNLYYKGRDEAVLASLSWASFYAAARIGAKLGLKFKPAEKSAADHIAKRGEKVKNVLLTGTVN